MAASEDPPPGPDTLGAVTRLLHEANGGRDDALQEVFPIVYDELNRLARVVRRGGASATLNTTALVHEAYLRLAPSGGIEWDGRRHFFRVAARAMRQVLVYDARRRGAQKRGGGQAAVTLNEEVHGSPMGDDQLLALHETLETLAAIDERQAAVVEVRFFAGLSIDETAEVLGISPATVSRDWAFARAWLAHHLSP